MVTLAASVFLFLALVTGAIALLAPARFGRRASEERIRALRPTGGSDDPEGAASPSLKRPYSSIPTLRTLLSGSARADAIALELQQANVHLRVGEYLLARVLLALVLFLAIVFFSQFRPVGLIIGAAAGGTAYVLPGLYLQLLRRRRLARIEGQLVEFLPMLASSLRAGFAFQQGVEMAVQQLGPPLADELLLLLSDVNLGATMEAALQDLGRRVGSTDLDMLITAVLIQRTTGGNLSEILEQAGETLRERERIRGDIQTLTAQQRFTGAILSVYPAVIGLLLVALVPSIWSLLFTDTLGRVFLGSAVTLQLVGLLFMRRVMKIEI